MGYISFFFFQRTPVCKNSLTSILFPVSATTEVSDHQSTVPMIVSEESHNVEIRQSPLIITQGSNPSNPREHDKESQPQPKAASTKPSAFSNITKMALLKEKEKGSERGNVHNNDIP